MFINAVEDGDIGFLVAVDSVFGAKQGGQIDLRGIQQHADGTLPVAVDAGGMGEQANPFAAQRREALLFQRVNTETDARYRHGSSHFVLCAGRQWENGQQERRKNPVKGGKSADHEGEDEDVSSSESGWV